MRWVSKMDPIPFLDLSYQNDPIESELKAAVKRVISSGQYILGPEVEAFEQDFAEFCEVPYAVATNSGTSALHLGLLALDVKPGDEVITVAFTFAATVESILYCGARPVLVDIDPDTLVMDVSKVEAAITEKTKVIVPVHLYGNPVDMKSLKEMADRHGVPILEDACQAHGALHHGRPAGSWGDAGVFSFYPTKNLGAMGEGGIIVTSSEKIADTARILRNHGETEKYVHSWLGFNYRMTAFQGTILRTKLPHLKPWNTEHRQLADQYRKQLADLEDSGLRIVQETPDSEAVYHLYAVRFEERDRVQGELSDAGIATQIHYPVPLHKQPAFSTSIVPEDGLPVSDMAAEQVLSLPIYPGMSENAVSEVVKQIRESISRI